MPNYIINNANLYYEVIGEGPALIFTHGASLNYQQWDKQAIKFKDNYKVITWDVRGHGNSSLPEGPVNPDDFSADLIGLMNYLKIDNAVLCGLSMGGHISLQTAIKYPKRVKGLILIGTPCSNSFNLYQKITVPINRFCTRLIPKDITAQLMAKALSKYNPDNYQYMIDSFALISPDNWQRLWSAITRMDSKDELHKVKCSTLILIGEHDNLTRSMQSYMHNNISHSELKTIPNAHHGTNLDNPDAVNEEIAQFIEKIGYN